MFCAVVFADGCVAIQVIGADIQDRGKTKPQRFGTLELKTREFQNVEVRLVRQVKPGDAFVALPGSERDGRQYIEAAFERGASAVLCEAQGASEHGDSRVVPLPALRSRLGVLANRFYGSPSDALILIAVTGTNGKTSVMQPAA